MTERWLFTCQAIEAIKNRLKVSTGRAQTLLRARCASGDIRAVARNSGEVFVVIPPGRWTDLIDVNTDLVLHDDTRGPIPNPGWGLRWRVEFSEDDLRECLTQPVRSPQPAPPKHTRSSDRRQVRRGPKAEKLKRVIQQMRDEISAGKLTLDTLAGLSEKALAARYGVGRDTARKARDEIDPWPERAKKIADK